MPRSLLKKLINSGQLKQSNSNVTANNSVVPSTPTPPQQVAISAPAHEPLGSRITSNDVLNLLPTVPVRQEHLQHEWINVQNNNNLSILLHMMHKFVICDEYFYLAWKFENLHKHGTNMPQIFPVNHPLKAMFLKYCKTTYNTSFWSLEWNSSSKLTYEKLKFLFLT